MNFNQGEYNQLISSLNRISDCDVWVILYKGKVIEGARKSSFSSLRSAKGSLTGYLDYRSHSIGISGKLIRERLEEDGLITYKNLNDEEN